MAKNKKPADPVFTVFALWQGEKPQAIAATADICTCGRGSDDSALSLTTHQRHSLGRCRCRSRAIDRADAVLRSWSTSHSVTSEPEVWVEDENGVKVYEAWILRRRVRHLGTGETRVETPIQLWRDEIDAWKSGRHEGVSIDAVPKGTAGIVTPSDAPFPVGHLMFGRPADYGCETLEPFANPHIVQNRAPRSSASKSTAWAQLFGRPNHLGSSIPRNLTPCSLNLTFGET